MAGLDAAIEAARHFRDVTYEAAAAVEALNAALDSLPAERTVHVRVDTSGMPEAAAAAAAAAGAGAGTRARPARDAHAVLDQVIAGEAAASARRDSLHAAAIADARMRLAQFSRGAGTGAGGGGGGPWAALWRFWGNKIPLFGGAAGSLGLTGFPAAISGAHLLADALAETAAVVVPATVAFAAFGAAAVPAVHDIYVQVQNVNTASTALGTHVPGLAGGFSKVAAAVKPQVYQLFGEALVTASHSTGTFGALATGAGKALDDLGARLAYAVTQGHGFGTFTHNAVSDLSGIGNLIGNLGGILGAVFKVVPGYAEDLLRLANGITHVAEVAANSSIGQHLLGIGMAAHGAIMYLGLLATGATMLITRALPAVAVVAARAAAGVGRLGRAGAAASGGLWRFAGAAEAATGWQWGWISLAATGIGILAWEMMQAKSAAQQFNQSMSSAVTSAPLRLLSGTISSAMGQTAARVAVANQQVAVTSRLTSNHAGVLGRYAGSVNAAYLDASASASQYQSGLQSLAATQVLVRHRVAQLSAAYGGNTAAMALMNAAGITSAQITNRNSQHWAQARIEIKAQQKALDALGRGTGRYGAAMNALGNKFMTQTLPALQKVTQAQDAVLNVVLAAPQAFTSFQQSLGTLSSAAGQSGASVGGLNKNSLSLASDYYGTAVPALQKMVDSLQQQDIATSSLTKVVATGAKEILPFTKGNAEARSVLMALINNALGPGTVSMRSLNTWIKANATSLKGMNGIVAESTMKAGNLAGVLRSELNYQFHQALLQSSHATRELRRYTDMLVHNKQNTADGQGVRAHLIHDLRQAGFSAKEAGKYVDGLATALHRIPKNTTATVTVTTYSRYINAAGTVAPGPYASGYVLPTAKKHAAGWKVPGHGHGDTVPAMLEPGEAVVPRHLVPAVAPFLAAHHVPGFSGGGVVAVHRHGAWNMGDVMNLWLHETWGRQLRHARGPLAAAQMRRMLSSAGMPAHMPLAVMMMAAGYGFGGGAPGAVARREAAQLARLLAAEGIPAGGPLAAAWKHSQLGAMLPYATADLRYWHVMSRRHALAAAEKAQAAHLKHMIAVHEGEHQPGWVKYYERKLHALEAADAKKLGGYAGEARRLGAEMRRLRAGWLPPPSAPGWLPSFSGQVTSGRKNSEVHVHLHGDLARDELWDQLQVRTLEYGYLNSGEPTGIWQPGG